MHALGKQTTASLNSLSLMRHMSRTQKQALYYCCKSDEGEMEKEEVEKPDLAKSSPAHHSNFPILSHSLQPPSSPSSLSPPIVLTSPSSLSNLCLPEHSFSNQLLTTQELYKSSCPANYIPALSTAPMPSYMFCPSCSGLLPLYLPREQELRNGGGRISYRTLEEQDVDLPSNISSFNQLNLMRSITGREVVTHMSISTDV
ncbi:hypothetical protein Baya_8163 [Bagarius yarrelli]|uniref:Uncharacterized protein n=1 Tax=Bagarius yarrelli TaxID=175774 RepID=A0A556U5C7_BAGYA|nr:hypothetical protein Baya_8163 [Bagarius yarrelli]